MKENIETNPFDGVYKRIGTIQYVKGVPVDTVYISDLEEKDQFRQMKIFSDGYINWFTDLEIPKRILKTERLHGRVVKVDLDLTTFIIKMDNQN